MSIVLKYFTVFYINFVIINGDSYKVYETNPFINGVFQSGISVPQGPVNDPPKEPVSNSPPIITSSPKPPETPTGELNKYCLQTRGTFQSSWCNGFVNCWDNNVVEQFCGVTLMFNPKGYCDYAYNVNCYGKPIKDVKKPIGTHGWPSDGSYRPPPTTSELPSSSSPPTAPGPPSRPLPITVGPPTRPPNYRPSLVSSGPPITIEPPGFPGGTQSDPTLPPVYRPPHNHTHPTTAPPQVTITWFPGTNPSGTPPVGSPHLRKYCLRPRGQFAGPNCQKFINCWDDVVIEQDCPDGLNFNPLKSYCDFPFNYQCPTIKEGSESRNYSIHDNLFKESSKVDNNQV